MLQINFTPFPELSTERLVLKQIVKTDAADIFKFKVRRRGNALYSKAGCQNY